MLECLFNNVAGLRPATLKKKETPTQVLSSEFCEIFKNTYFEEYMRTAASEFCKIPGKTPVPKSFLIKLKK